MQKTYLTFSIYEMNIIVTLRQTEFNGDELPLEIESTDGFATERQSVLTHPQKIWPLLLRWSYDFSNIIRT
jgi:hypothetical protein